MSQIVLITGSSSGIGKATALYFAQRGWTVVASMRRPEKADAELAMLDKPVLDVTDRESIHRCVQYIIDRYGKIDVLVNNAGLYSEDPLGDVSEESCAKQFDTNVMGLIWTTKAVIPEMQKQKHGTIINISSISGRIALPFNSIYDATKFAVEGFSESLWYEASKHNIKVKVVAPGPVRTPALASISWEPRPGYHENPIRIKKIIFSLHTVSPVKISKTIYKAAKSSSSKLRYSYMRSTLFLHAILPSCIWRRILRALMM